jgi:RNA polymerase sigma-70 factor (ECF subfamily)
MQVADPETWVDQHGDYLYGYALSRMKDPTIAEDLVQETLLAALNDQKSFEGRSSLRTWLIAILKHKIIDYLRKASREQPLDDRELGADVSDTFFDEKGNWMSRPANWTTDPTELLEQKEFLEVFTRCLSELPARQAHAFRLREMDGLDCGGICNVMEITSSNCWVMLYRARMNMRQCIEANWFDHQRDEDT